MVKKAVALLWTLLLICGCASAAESDIAQSTAEDFFRSLEGQISFTVPGLSRVYREHDLLADSLGESGTLYYGWQNKLQLSGTTAEETEYQVHIGDLTSMLEKMRSDAPQSSEMDLQLNAMTHFAWFYMSLYDGNFVEEPVADQMVVDGRSFPVLTFSYAYPDAEDVAYIGKGMMDGTKAVIFMGQKSDALDRLLAEMQVIPAAEAEAFRARPAQKVSLGRMEITFPVPPDVQQTGISTFYDAFTPEYAYLSVEHLPFDLSSMMGEMDADSFLEGMAQSAAAGYQQQGAIGEYTVSKIAENAYRVDAYGTLSEVEQQVMAREHIHMYVSLTGVYTVYSVDTPAGDAFLDSIIFE